MKREDWIKRSLAKKKLETKMPSSWSENEKASARREVISRLYGTTLLNLKEEGGVLEETKGQNIENAIGVTRIPFGVAGPLKVKGDWVRGNYFVPLATTEGALVASINRGCKAINSSRGAVVKVRDVGMSRAPVFKVSGINQASDFLDWLDSQREKISKLAERSVDHLRLTDITSKLVGRSLFLRLVFDTDEAMGMNMATIATDSIVRFIEKEQRVKCVSLTGNYCVDKKPAYVNYLYGRGKEVWGEVQLSAAVIKKILKTNSKDLIEVAYRKLLVGSSVSGSMGFNAQHANVVAAIFLACGQDMAHVVEGSLGATSVERDGEGIYFSVYLPSLIVGTVGGGTHLAAQNTALQLLGLGKGSAGEAMKFAEIIAGAVLAGEISLVASLAEGSLAKAHQRLGRGGNDT
jgi:hydroxymethylglutaryl-CoA reductase (NADPH)